MEIKIFYSWQNSPVKNYNRYFIEKSINAAIKIVNKNDIDINKKVILDQATRNTKGAVEIATTIFSKINKCQFYIADISIVNSTTQKKFPNSNVLIELGYAASKIGWDRIIMIFNTAKGSIEDLPFDIRGRRILNYHLESDLKMKIEKEKLTKELAYIISDSLPDINTLKNNPTVKIITYVYNIITSQAEEWRRLITEIYEASSINNPDKFHEFSPDEFEKALSKVNTYSNPKGNVLSIYKNWFQYISSIANNTSNNLKTILLFQNKIDSEIIGMVCRVDSRIMQFQSSYTIPLNTEEALDNHLMDVEDIGDTKKLMKEKILGIYNLKNFSRSIIEINLFLEQTTLELQNKYSEHLDESGKQYYETIKASTIFHE